MSWLACSSHELGLLLIRDEGEVNEGRQGGHLGILYRDIFYSLSREGGLSNFGLTKRMYKNESSGRMGFLGLTWK